MPEILRIVAKGMLYTLGALVGVVVLYVAVSVVLSLIPVGQRSQPGPGKIEAYLLSNGVHMDLVVPVHNQYVDWRPFVPYAHTAAADTTMRYVGIGWGDKGFYLDTPTWSQLKPSTAFKAMFWLSTSAMHVTFHHRPQPGPLCVALYLTPAEYTHLTAFIQRKFDLDAQGRPQHIEGHSYGQYDAFYEAHGTYNLFDTCDTWANRGLKVANQKAALWTPLDKGMLWQYQ